MSPSQLVVEGLCVSSQYESPTVQSDSDLLGPSTNLVETTPEEVVSVEIPSNKFVPCTQVFSQLQSSVDPMSHCNDLSKRFFVAFIHHVYCTNCCACTMCYDIIFEEIL